MDLQQKDSEETWHLSTWAHRAWLASGCATVIFSIAKSLSLTPAKSLRLWIEFALVATAAYVAVDLASGIYHWAVDNYGTVSTPIFGSQIHGFVDHHRQPSEITKRQLANNLHVAAIAVTAVVLPINLVFCNRVLLLFVGVFAGWVILGQQFHAWAHTTKGKLPRLAVALQDAGIILKRAEHAAHHRPPYNNNYCIISGMWNRVLDKSNFFVALEVVVNRVLGYRPRSWSGPGSERGEIN